MHALTLKVSTMKIKRNFLVDLGFCVFKNLILDAIFNCFISIAVIISHVKYSNLDETFKIIKATTVTSWFYLKPWHHRQSKLYACKLAYL